MNARYNQSYIAHYLRLLFLLVASYSLLNSGCGKAKETVDPRIGIMNDTSYLGSRNNLVRLNVLREEVRFEDFEGYFIWTDYAAPWCQYCRQQSSSIRNLKNNYSDERVVFLTVITSDTYGPTGKSREPTIQTAKNWQQQTGLDAGKVLVARNRWGMVVPQHILFSPDGHALYRKQGLHSEQQIREILAKYITEWTNWKQSGTVATWMKID